MARGVSIEHVSFGYGTTAVLDDISLDVAKGEFFAFLGPSGSGKTTLLASRRRVRHAEPRQHPDRRARRHRPAAVEPQRRHGVPELCAVAAHERRQERRVRPGAAQALAAPRSHARSPPRWNWSGLTAYADRRPSQLSGGQQQRVALARTIVIEPEVLLLDEPLSNLDAKLRVEMRSELKMLQRKLGITAIYVTHDQEEANAVADRIAVLDQGRIQQIGAPTELYDHPANRFVATFLGTANLIEGRIAGGNFSGGGLVLGGVGGPDGPACISIRPQDVTLGPTGLGTAATVESFEFLGGTVRYRLRMGEQRMMVDTPHRRDGATHAVGSAVGISVDPRQIAVLR